MSPVAQRGRRDGPKPIGIGRHRAQRRRALVQHHGCERLSQAGNRRSRDVGQRVRRRTAVGRGRQRQTRRSRRNVAEQGDACEGADQGVEIAVAIDVDDARRPHHPGVAQPERVGADQREAGRRRRPDVAVDHRVTDDVADQDVEVAVAVDVHHGRRRLPPRIAEAEGIGADQGEAGRCRRSDVAVEQRVAALAADQDVEVAVAVEVRDARRREGDESAEPEGVGGLQGEAGRRRGSDIAQEQQGAGVASDQDVEVAIAVEVREGRGGHRRAAQPKGGGGGIQGEAGRGRAADVAVELKIDADVSDQDVEIAIPVDVHEDRLGLGEETVQAEGIGGFQDEAGIARHADRLTGQRARGVARGVRGLRAGARRRVVHRDALIDRRPGVERQGDCLAAGGDGGDRPRHAADHHREGSGRSLGTVQQLRIGQGQLRPVQRRRGERRRPGVDGQRQGRRGRRGAVDVARRDGQRVRAIAQRGGGERPQAGGGVGRHRADGRRAVVQHHRRRGGRRSGDRRRRDVGQRVGGRAAVRPRRQHRRRGGRGRRRDVPVEDRLAIVPADQRVEVAVPVDVREGRLRVVADVAQVEGVGSLQREGGCRRRPDVPVKDRVAAVVADQRVEVAIPIDVHEDRRGVASDIAEAEGIGAFQREGGGRRRSDVPIEERIAIRVADQGVEIAVAVDVHQGRRREAPDIAQAEGIGAHQGEAGRRRRPDVAVDDDAAARVAGQQVEVAVAVDVREDRLGVGGHAAADGVQAEGVGAHQGEARRIRRADIPVDDDVGVPVADHRVEVAVAVDVGEDRGGLADEAAEAERVGGFQGELGVAAHADRLAAQGARGVAGGIHGLGARARRGVADRRALIDRGGAGIQRQDDCPAVGGDRGDRAHHATHRHREGAGHRSLSAVQRLRIDQRQPRPAQHRRGQRRRRRVDGHAQRRRSRRRAVGGACLDGQRMRAVAQRRRRDRPQARAVGGRGAHHGRPVVQHHCGEGLSRPGDRRRRDLGQRVRRRTAVRSRRQRQTARCGRRRRTVAEQHRITVRIADQGVEVAVTIDVHEDRCGVVSDVAEAEGVGALQDESGRRRRPDVAIEVCLAIPATDQGVEVAVTIDVQQLRRRADPDVAEAEGVGGLQREGGLRRRPDVAIEDRVAVVNADQGVKVAIPVDIRQFHRRSEPGAAETEGVGTLQREGGLRRRPDVAIEVGVAASGADQGVKIAVAVEVGEGRLRPAGTHGVEAEGVGALQREGGLRRRPDVAIEDYFAGEVADQGVEVAVTIDVHEDRCGVVPNIAEAEEVGAFQGEGRITNHRDSPAVQRARGVAGRVRRLRAGARRGVVHRDALIGRRPGVQRQGDRPAAGDDRSDRPRDAAHRHREGRGGRLGAVQRLRISQSQLRSVQPRRGQSRRGGVGRVVGDRLGGEAGGIAAGRGLYGVGIVAHGRVGVGDGDRVRVRDRLGERERDRLVGAVHSDVADRDRGASDLDREGAGRRRVGRVQRAVVGEHQRRAVHRRALKHRRRGDRHHDGAGEDRTGEVNAGGNRVDADGERAGRVRAGGRHVEGQREDGALIDDPGDRGSETDVSHRPAARGIDPERDGRTDQRPHLRGRQGEGHLLRRSRREGDGRVRRYDRQERGVGGRVRDRDRGDLVDHRGVAGGPAVGDGAQNDRAGLAAAVVRAGRVGVLVGDAVDQRVHAAVAQRHAAQRHRGDAVRQRDRVVATGEAARGAVAQGDVGAADAQELGAAGAADVVNGQNHAGEGLTVVHRRGGHTIEQVGAAAALAGRETTVLCRQSQRRRHAVRVGRGVGDRLAGEAGGVEAIAEGLDGVGVVTRGGVGIGNADRGAVGDRLGERQRDRLARGVHGDAADGHRGAAGQDGEAARGRNVHGVERRVVGQHQRRAVDRGALQDRRRGGADGDDGGDAGEGADVVAAAAVGDAGEGDDALAVGRRAGVIVVVEAVQEVLHFVSRQPQAADRHRQGAAVERGAASDSEGAAHQAGTIGQIHDGGRAPGDHEDQVFRHTVQDAGHGEGQTGEGLTQIIGVRRDRREEVRRARRVDEGRRVARRRQARGVDRAGGRDHGGEAGVGEIQARQVLQDVGGVVARGGIGVGEADVIPLSERAHRGQDQLVAGDDRRAQIDLRAAHEDGAGAQVQRNVAVDGTEAGQQQRALGVQGLVERYDDDVFTDIGVDGRDGGRRGARVGRIVGNRLAGKAGGVAPATAGLDGVGVVVRGGVGVGDGDRVAIGDHLAERQRDRLVRPVHGDGADRDRGAADRDGEGAQRRRVDGIEGLIVGEHQRIAGDGGALQDRDGPGRAHGQGGIEAEGVQPPGGALDDATGVVRTAVRIDVAEVDRVAGGERGVAEGQRQRVAGHRHGAHVDRAGASVAREHDLVRTVEPGAGGAEEQAGRNRACAVEGRVERQRDGVLAGMGHGADQGGRHRSGHVHVSGNNGVKLGSIVGGAAVIGAGDVNCPDARRHVAGDTLRSGGVVVLQVVDERGELALGERPADGDHGGVAVRRRRGESDRR
ncbi:hypothetical protein FH063_005143 [Azospirillum argentinense]|uniref:Uncharacterized protein n=1 Tax=Azospirillum argentinense TaxID=2970906 RepID=A0A5B0KXP2_9PROT|nr:hypothetical protein FH063_005143 [Azospirillum argentinense]